ncbi:hypothetical protein [Arsukibacterium sp.]|uniref:hypothetical protein n=1 Tax=Arsukibacterium sp. TaxID=1977258 RepID=UPI001BD4D241|nr:hypothetical protein [Arsukibacterium sp.]
MKKIASLLTIPVCWLLLLSNTSNAFVLEPKEKPAEQPKAVDASFYSHSVLAALIVAGPAVSLKPDVVRDWKKDHLRHNIKAMLNKVFIIDRELQRDLINMRNLWSKDQREPDYYLPVTSIQDFELAGELNARLEEVADRDIDMLSYVYMTQEMESYFNIRYSTKVDRNVCWGAFVTAFEQDEKKQAAVKQGCEAFDRIHQTLLEMRRIDHAAETRRAEVSKQQYEGKIKPRENAFRNKLSPWYQHLKTY